MTFTKEDIDQILGFKKPKPRHVPALNDADVPELTPKAIANAVQNDRPIWKLLSQAAAEDEAEKRAKKLSDRYDMTPIPRPDFDPCGDF